MSFIRYIQVLQALAMSPDGATRGAIEKLCPHLTRGMIERALRDLRGEGFVRVEKKRYTSKIDAVIYHIKEGAIQACEYVTNTYDMYEHPKELPGMEAENDKAVS